MEKKVAVVTGAASGIGYSVLNYLKKRDIDVVAVDIVNMKVFDDIFYHCDVSSEENVRATADIIENKVGRIDYLVLAAGILCVNGKLITLCHYPLLEWNGSRRAGNQKTSNSWLIHGHIHNSRDNIFEYIRDNLPCALNCGVDINDFEPVTFEELLKNNNKWYGRNEQ